MNHLRDKSNTVNVRKLDDWKPNLYKKRTLSESRLVQIHPKPRLYGRRTAPGCLKTGFVRILVIKSCLHTLQKNNFQAHFDPEELFRNIFGEFSRNYRSGGRGGFQDIFQDFSPFGFGSAAQETVVNLTFQQAAKGVVKEIEIIQVSGSARWVSKSWLVSQRAEVYCDALKQYNLKIGRLVLKSYFLKYSKRPKTEGLVFGAFRNGSVAKRFGFQTTSENRTIWFGYRTFGLFSSFFSSKLDHFT